jgi:ABC-type polysaccharide/polyol phosphate export permease
MIIKRFIHDIQKYFRYSIVSAKSQLKVEVADSYLNWIWWFLEPLCFMLIYNYVFGHVFNAREQYFSVYIFIGLSMWSFFNKMVQGSVKIIRLNKSVISRVYFPKYILLLTKTWVNGFKMLVSFGIVVVMMLVFRVPVTWNVLYAIPILLILVLFTFGCSCFLMHWGVYVNDLSNAIKILTKMLFYITGVFYNLEKRIPEIGTALNRYNPVAFLLSSMRQCLIYGQTPMRKLMLLWFAVSLLLAYLGIRTIYKEENSYVKAI